MNEDEQSKELLHSIIDRYLNHSTYFFPDLFGQVSKGRFILERLYPHLIANITSNDYLETILIHIYGSLSYMIHRCSTTFIIEPIVMIIISSIQQQINAKKTTFEQLFPQINTYYIEHIKSKLDDVSSSSPFSDPILFTNSSSVSLLIDLLLFLERRSYLLAGVNSSNLPVHIVQQLQYQLSEPIRLVVTDLCQALLACSPPLYTQKKMLKPFAQVQQQQFGLLLKFLRIQLSNSVYPTLESKLIFSCVKSD